MRSPAAMGSKPPTPEELTKRISMTNILREREACAKIAEGNWHPLSNTLSPEYVLRHQIAAEIRAQSEDFRTVAEMMEPENA